jgi:hydroxyacylglutathione hydrolase
VTRLRDHLRLVGSGAIAESFSDELDCHVYLLDGGDELALIDAGAGLASEALLANVAAAGHDPATIGTLLLTHGHGDHAGGAAQLRERLGLRVLAPALARGPIEEGDEHALSVALAREAGIYPPGFALAPCPIDGELTDGQRFHVGSVAIEVLDAPGHCRGHVAMVVEHGGVRDLLAGDAVFDRGRVALQPIHDCDIGDLTRTLRRLRTLELDGLLAGHGELVLDGASAHIEHANRQLDRLLLPEQLNSPGRWQQAAARST